MTEAEDDIVGDHSRVMRGMSATGMRLMEIIQRRREEQRRREADGQREAAEALRDRQQAQRDAARTIAAQGLDPQWRERASDSEIATAYVYAEAYAQTDPLAKVAHDQLSDHLTARHENVAEFVDSNLSQGDLDRVPAPEGTPSPTQQRWMDAARAADAADRYGEQLEQLEAAGPETQATSAGEMPRTLDAAELERMADQTISQLLGEDPHTMVLRFKSGDLNEEMQSAKAKTVILDSEALKRWSDQTIGDLAGPRPDSIVVIPDLTEQQRLHRIGQHLASVGDEVANQWADLTEQFGRDRADAWLEGNLTESELARMTKWQLWNEAQREIAEGATIQDAMEELAEREADLGLDLQPNDYGARSPEDLAGDLAEHEGKAAIALERGDLEHAGLGQFAHERSVGDLEQRDPQAASVLKVTQPGRSQSAATQVARAAQKKSAEQRKAHTNGQERGPARDHGRSR
ncbi:hypothetical protein V1260_15370 [Brachybacterium sp. J144]|uniref:hypothetical protein n=1 Tax=Brachybacterium sp. J144 TaxID=3116487 RepID=UPI002E75AE55|nr:hypothetical protein [Brachybacterium sp. J144]MEE1652161.1 hypothetical protein [Brachybacterium sp. J144]